MKSPTLHTTKKYITLELLDWKIEYDPSQTIELYNKIEQGGANHCHCDYCKNFNENRDVLFPLNFRSILIQLGINPNKEVEAYHIKSINQNEQLYGGWFHFVGNLVEAKYNNLRECRFKEFSKGFFLCLTSTIELPNPEFKNLNLVQLEYRTTLPWVLKKPLEKAYHI